jgi:hypothetical protein
MSAPSRGVGEGVVWYCRGANDAPEDAVEVGSHVVGGQLILDHWVGVSGEYLYGAQPACSCSAPCVHRSVPCGEGAERGAD